MLPFSLSAQDAHTHPAPEKLGAVSFPISCTPAVQQPFNRGVALLHSFAYKAAEDAFRSVAEQDSQCAMARWGVAMTHFHQLWYPPLSQATISIAREQIQRARAGASSSERERKFIDALGLIFEGDYRIPYRTRVLNYELAMSDLAAGDKNDTEAQVFYALALLADASPMDKSHAKQKRGRYSRAALSRLPAAPWNSPLPHSCL
jgi:hypothetical protein